MGRKCAVGAALLAIGLASASYALADVGALNREVVRLSDQGKYREAVDLATRALAEAEATLGPTHAVTSTALNNLAAAYESVGRYDDALPLYKRALAIREALGPDDARTSTSLNNLAFLYKSMGRYDEALPLYERALAIMEKARGPDHANTAPTLINLAGLYKDMGRYDEALPLYKRALTINERALGPDHASSATSLDNMAVLYTVMDRLDDALQLHERALAINEKALGPDHASTATSLGNVAFLYKTMGRYDEALPLYKRALAINESAFGPHHASTATSLNNLARVHEVMGRHDEALALYRRALRAVVATDFSDPKRDHGAIRELAIFSATLARALSSRQDVGSLDEAIFYFKLSVNTRQRMRASTRGLDQVTRESFTRSVAEAYRALSDLLIQRGRGAEAERVLLLLQQSDVANHLTRHGQSDPGQQSLSWTAEEEAYRQDLETVASQWREFGSRRLAVMEAIGRGQFSASGPEVAELESRRVELETRAAKVMSAATQRFVEASQHASQRH